ncbi:MAG: DinB family protein [Bacteroidetes bacterium]|nr:DinB family protein [Bacteroidota bacterium]
MKNSEINRLIDQIVGMHNNKNWAGFDLYGILKSITVETANMKLPEFNHTIHQIAQHLVTDLVVIKRLQGIDHKIPIEENWIPADEINFKWTDTVNSIKENKNELIRELQKLSDEDLDKPILKDFSSIYENLHGYIQHSCYHFGQIALMKKFIDNLRK